MNNKTKKIIAREFIVLLGTGMLIGLLTLIVGLIEYNDNKLHRQYTDELDSIEEKIIADGLRYWDFMNLLHLNLIEYQKTENTNPNSFVFWKSACNKYHANKVEYRKRVIDAINVIPNEISREWSFRFNYYVGNNWETIEKTLENEPYGKQDSASWLQFVVLDKARNERVKNILALEQSWTHYTSDENFGISVLLIVISIAFPVRYLVYMTRWSISNLKSS